MGCAERSKYEVVTERIPYLIESMTDLRVGNALVVLKGSLRGFKDLHRRHGGIAIKENMIGKSRFIQGSMKRIRSRRGSMKILPSIGRKRTRRIKERWSRGSLRCLGERFKERDCGRN